MVRAADRERQRIEEDQLERIRDINQQAAASFADLFTSAITGAEGLKGSIADLAEQLGRMALTRGFEALLSGVGFGGGPVGDVLDGIFGLGGNRASGGPVSRGVPYMVGERGREIFVPQQAGNIVPNGGGGKIEVVLGPDLEGRILSRAQGQTIGIVAQQMRAGRATLRDEMADFQKDPWRR
jgi:hypothetical protein